MAWVGLVLLTDMPYAEESGYACAFCRAGLRERRYFLVPFCAKIYESSFSRWYRQEVEPEHSHIWQFGSAELRCIRGVRNADGSAGMWPPLSLRSDTAMAICRCMPSRASRKAFFHLLYTLSQGRARPGLERTQNVRDTIRELNSAYEANPSRKDWPELLRKLDLYPRSANRH